MSAKPTSEQIEAQAAHKLIQDRLRLAAHDGNRSEIESIKEELIGSKEYLRDMGISWEVSSE